MDKPKTTPKDFFLWTGSMISFYWSVLASILLIFDYINYAFPNVLAYYPSNPYDSGIPYEMASIIVLLPIFLWLMHLIHKDAIRDQTRNELWVRRWILIFTLFVAGIAIAGDLITLLTTFLSGEALTTAFVLKVIVVLLVAAGILMHFSADLKGYWDQFPARKRYVGIGVVVLGAAIIIAGFFIVGTPQQARLERFDVEKISDLQSIQSQVTYYWQAKRALPTKLSDVSDSVSLGTSLPVDAQTGESYEYRVNNSLSFSICATFNAQSRPALTTPAGGRAIMPVTGKVGASDNWQHGAGHVCFDRTIDPSFYPTLK